MHALLLLAALSTGPLDRAAVLALMGDQPQGFCGTGNAWLAFVDRPHDQAPSIPWPSWFSRTSTAIEWLPWPSA